MMSLIFFRPIHRSFSSTAVRYNVRVRFAPSPTGFLHLGSLRTALCNFLFAKKNAGQFILRIEDTDQTRVVAGGIEGIERDLQWTGLCPDEGPAAGGPVGPYLQSQRLHIYQEKANQLLESGHAYRCFCSKTRIDLVRKEAARNRQIPRYDNSCRHLTATEVSQKLKAKELFTIRLKLTDGPITFHDLVTGEECIDLSKVEADPIILKSDGFPTYHLANVVDDHTMLISHVFRGIEWQQATPKHLMISEALGITPPAYGHLPLIQKSDGSKLSKRLADIRLDNMREEGYFPETIVNYLARMGRSIRLSSEEEDTFLSLSELADRFVWEQIQSRASGYDFLILKRKNREYIQHCIDTDRLAIRQKVKNLVEEKLGKDDIVLDDEYVDHVLQWSRDLIHFLPELVNEFLFVWRRPHLTFDTTIFDTSIGQPARRLEEVINHLKEKDSDLSCLKAFCSERGIKYPSLCHFIRSCLTNKSEGPALTQILLVLGKDKFHDYLRHAVLYCKQEQEKQ